MNKQEIEKAIKILNPKNFGFSNRPEYEALNLAISVLEQQIPKKPIEEQGISPRCPYCDNANYLTNEDEEDNKFCGNCGQAIDWRNEDE